MCETEAPDDVAASFWSPDHPEVKEKKDCCCDEAWVINFPGVQVARISDFQLVTCSRRLYPTEPRHGRVAWQSNTSPFHLSGGCADATISTYLLGVIGLGSPLVPITCRTGRLTQAVPLSVIPTPLRRLTHTSIVYLPPARPWNPPLPRGSNQTYSPHSTSSPTSTILKTILC